MDTETLKTITQLEESLWRSEMRFDAELMRRTFAQDVFEFGQSGRTYTREDLLSANDETPIDVTLPLRAFQARHLSPDVVLVTYISEIVLKDLTKNTNRSSIWSYQDGTWRLRFHQGTPVPS